MYTYHLRFGDATRKLSTTGEKVMGTKKRKKLDSIVCTRLHENEIRFLKELSDSSGIRDAALIRALIRMAIFDIGAPGSDVAATYLKLSQFSAAIAALKPVK